MNQDGPLFRFLLLQRNNENSDSEERMRNGGLLPEFCEGLNREYRIHGKCTYVYYVLVYKKCGYVRELSTS
jgi:hypothetical protein